MGFREKCYFATMLQQPRRHLMQIGLDAADQAMRTVGYRYSQRITKTRSASRSVS